MRISDVVTVIARSPLSAYPWGQEVVDLVNAYVEAEHKVSLKDTGSAVFSNIETIKDVAVRQFLLNKEISAVAPPVGMVETDAEYTLPKGYIRDYRPIAITVIALGLVMICLVLAIGTNIQMPESAKKKTTGVMATAERVIDAATKAMKGQDASENGSEPSSTPETSPQTSQKPSYSVPRSSSTTRSPATSSSLQRPPGG